MADAVTVDQLGLGDHACLTFTDPDERMDLLAQFVADGLDGGHRVVCFTDSLSPTALTAELALREIATAAALRTRQLAVHDSHGSLLASGVVSAGKMISAIRGEVETAKTRDSMGYASQPTCAGRAARSRPPSS